MSLIKKTSSHLYFTLFLIIFITVSPFKMVSAQSAKELGTVINLSGKQRMLTQKMSKETFLIVAGVNVAENIKNLEQTSSLFDKTLKGLKVGDSELGLPATSSNRILRQLARVEKLWADFYPIVKKIVESGSATPDQISAIATQNVPLLKQMNKAVGAYEKEASKGNLQSDPGLAATLNLSGKQRMLTQKMSKEFLLIANDVDAAGNRLNLLETYLLFERTLDGLKSGDDTLGLPGTTDAGILKQLETVSGLWEKAKPVFEAAAKADSKINKQQIETVATLNIPLLKEMNKAVGMYESLAK